MSERAIVLYDDATARTFEPFALTRPVATLVAGVAPIFERWGWAGGLAVDSVIAAAHLREFDESGAPHVVDAVPAGAIVANSRFAPALTARLRDEARVWSANGRVVAVRVEDAVATRLRDGRLTLDELAADAPRVDLEGWWMDAPWDLVRHLAPMLVADIDALAAGALGRGDTAGAPKHVTVIGDHTVRIASGAEAAVIEPHVVIDASTGPVYVGAGSHVRAFTRLTGPCYIGRHVTVMGGDITGSSVGDHCKVRGEISATTFLGYSNKGHDGFVGHSYLGRWTNLGAGTTTSNLKNTYGTVALWTPQGVRDTGLQFLGTLAGDHAKTGIGLRLTTGTVLGAGANVYDRMPPKHVAPFSWGAGEPYGTYRFEKFVEVAERVMARRHVTLSAAARRQLEAAFETAAG